MKKYPNGVISQDIGTSETIYFDIEGSEVKFRLPIDPENPNGFFKPRDLPILWRTAPQALPLAKRYWELNAYYEGSESLVGTVIFEMRLFYLDMIDYETWLGVEPYCLLKTNELNRLATEHYIKYTACTGADSESPVSAKTALNESLLHNPPKELSVAKQDLLPWMNLRLKKSNSHSCKCHTFIPISERALIIINFYLIIQNNGNKPFFFSDPEALEFERSLRDEFLGHFKINYSPETEEKIKLYAQQN